MKRRMLLDDHEREIIHWHRRRLKQIERLKARRRNRRPRPARIITNMETGEVTEQ